MASKLEPHDPWDSGPYFITLMSMTKDTTIEALLFNSTLSEEVLPGWHVENLPLMKALKDNGNRGIRTAWLWEGGEKRVPWAGEDSWEKQSGPLHSLCLPASCFIHCSYFTPQLLGCIYVVRSTTSGQGMLEQLTTRLKIKDLWAGSQHNIECPPYRI